MTDFADENCHDLLTNLAPNDDEIFDMFFWKKNNNTYISHTFTEVGLCYTFNLMSRERIFRDDVNYTIVPNGNIRNLTEYDWSPEKGFKRTDTINGYPLRTVVGGTKNTLELGLTTHPKDYDFLCEGPFQGYNVSPSCYHYICYWSGGVGGYNYLCKYCCHSFTHLLTILIVFVTILQSVNTET